MEVRIGAREDLKAIKAEEMPVGGAILLSTGVLVRTERDKFTFFSEKGIVEQNPLSSWTHTSGVPFVGSVTLTF